MLQEHRKDFTVFSGVSCPNVDGGHPAEVCFITAAPHPGSGSFRNTISLDQFMAERIGMLTRFPSITLAVNFGDSNQHTCFNMPALLAGGGFKHGQQLGFDREHNRNYNLCNLFVSMIQRMGIDADKFAGSTGTMRGLEMT